MKTNLPESINSVEEAKKFLTELFTNDEGYHPDDDANDIIWERLPEDQKPTQDEINQLNLLMDEIYDLKEFDACGFIIDSGLITLN